MLIRHKKKMNRPKSVIHHLNLTILFMTRKKSIVCRLATNIRKQYPALNVVNCTKDVSCVDDLEIFLNKSLKEPNTLFLVGRNDHSEDVFEFFESERIAKKDSKIILLSNGITTMSNETIDIRMIQKLLVKPDIKRECQICFEPMEVEGRQCDNCLESFCISCQIKFIIHGYFNDSGGMVCPFCRHNHSIPEFEIIDDEIFVNSMEERVLNELEIGTLTEKQADDLYSMIEEELCK
jgi:hypothetical protein